MSQTNFSNLGDAVFKIINSMSLNQKLCRLLKYQVADPFSSELPDVEGDSLVGNEINMIPKIPDQSTEKTSFVTALFDTITLNKENSDFVVSAMRFDIACPNDSWICTNSLRPFLIMQEISKLFQGKQIAGLGTMSFMNGKILVLSPQLSGYTIWYIFHDFK